MDKKIEARVFERFQADNKCRAKLIFADDVSVKDISLGGILVETTKRLNINSNYRIQIGPTKDKTISPLALVVRTSLKGTIKKKKNYVPLYQVALKFIELNGSEKGFLDTLISTLK